MILRYAIDYWLSPSRLTIQVLDKGISGASLDRPSPRRGAAITAAGSLIFPAQAVESLVAL